MSSPIKIAIAEDKQNLRDNLEQILQLLGDFRLLFSVNDGIEVLPAIKKFGEPDVILMDLEMPIKDGIQTTAEIKSLFPKSKILILTVFDQKDSVFRALKAGADGYLLKGEKPKQLLESIYQVYEGRMPMSPEIAAKTLQYFRALHVSSKDSPSDYSLTKREIEILELLCKGMAYKNIAGSCHISERTVNTHVDNIYRKLNVHSAVEANNIANKNDWF